MTGSGDDGDAKGPVPRSPVAAPDTRADSVVSRRIRPLQPPDPEPEAEPSDPEAALPETASPSPPRLHGTAKLMRVRLHEAAERGRRRAGTLRAPHPSQAGPAMVSLLFVRGGDEHLRVLKVGRDGIRLLGQAGERPATIEIGLAGRRLQVELVPSATAHEAAEAVKRSLHGVVFCEVYDESGRAAFVHLVAPRGI